MRKPPKLGRHVRSPEGGAWKVAEVFKSGLDTYTVTCEQDLAADLLLRVRDAVSPRDMRRKRRKRNHYP